MASNPLDKNNVVKIINISLGGAIEDPSSRAPLKSATEAIAIVTGIASASAGREGGPSRSNEPEIPRQPRSERDFNDPLRIPPRQPRPYPYGPPNPNDPPGFEDEYEINRPPGNPYIFPGGRNPYRIGDDDLNPPGLGPNPPLRGPFFGEDGGNGMFVGPNHPMFGGRQGGVPDPRFPPGSRYDPIGPGGIGGGLPRGPGRGGFGGFGSGDFI